MGFLQTAEAGHHLADQSWFLPIVIIGPKVSTDLAVDDHLTAPPHARLEQDRIHIHLRGQAGRLSLHHLGPPQFRALSGNEAVQGHVLSLEGCHPDAVLIKNAAQGSDHDALPDIGASAQDHQGTIFHRGCLILV